MSPLKRPLPSQTKIAQTAALLATRARADPASARERGVSVATVVRDAIDRGLPSLDDHRRAAARRLLDAPDMPVPEPDELRDELDRLRGRHG